MKQYCHGRKKEKEVEMIPRITIKPYVNDIQVYVWFDNRWEELGEWNLLDGSWTHIKYYGKSTVEKFIADIKQKAANSGFEFVDSPELSRFITETDWRKA